MQRKDIIANRIPLGITLYRNCTYFAWMGRSFTMMITAIGLITGTLQAQWNAIAGYEVMGSGSEQFNGLLTALNEMQMEPEQLAKPIELLHGFVAGVRYSHTLGAIELMYRRSLTRRRGEKYVIGTNAADIIDFSYAAAAYSLNFEFGKGLIFGGSIDYNILSQRVKYGGSGANNFRSFKDKQYSWGNRIFLGIHIANTNQISFSLRPFYHWHWSTTEIGAFRDHLKLTTEICESCKEQPKTFGISLIINNGPQH